MTREEAIEILKQYSLYSPTSQIEDALDMAIEALQDRPHGEWKNTITWQPYCSNCEYVFDEDEAYSPFWKFCPMCGAEMADNSLVNDITESPNDAVESKDDVIEVILCKDCRHLYNKDFCSFFGSPTDAMDYCSHGERREE